MILPRFRITRVLLVLKLACVAAIAIGAGAQLPELYAQATHVPSIFDPPADPGGDPAPADQATSVPASTPAPAVSATPDAGAAEVTAQATRVPSIFDPPADPGGDPAPADQATGVPVEGESPDAAGADVTAQPTRVPSIFDPPAGQGEPAPGGQADTSPEPTRVPSIFDAPGASSPGTDGTPQPTRIPSMFDSQAEPSGEAGGAAPAAPYTSLFDAAPGDVVTYSGEGLPDTAYCLDCHANPYVQLILPSGERISVAVDETAYMESVHGQHGTEGYRCIRCHTGMNEYPHEDVTAASSRELAIDYSTGCTRCHPDKYAETMDGVHFSLLAGGNQDAAVCADCHTGHAVDRLTDDITGDPLPGSSAASVAMCTNCHAAIYETYAASVHGSALLEGNPDVPVCADCHGVHDTEGPSTASFRLFSPETCAECHADEAMMAEYDISTNVFDTYVADFHGTTVSIFQDTAPDQAINSPVCVDCHGVHDIMAVDSENSRVMKANLMGTCQRCHPDAESDFPDAWLSHYEPSFDRTPLVALADVIYSIMIPTVVGGLGVFVMTDVYRRRASNHRKDR